MVRKYERKTDRRGWDKNNMEKPSKLVKESESETEDTECLYCQGLYSKSNEGWITCQMCGNWAHCSCAGVKDNDDEAIHIYSVSEDSDD